jgi:hypothetical protein
MFPRGHHVCTRFPVLQLVGNMLKRTCAFFATIALIAYGMQRGTIILSVGKEVASLLGV